MSRYNVIIKVALLLGLATATVTSTQAQQLYNWKDEKCATHYTQTPPPARQSQTLSIKARAAVPNTLVAPTAVSAKPTVPNAAQPTKPVAPVAPKLSAQACKDLKSNLDLLQSGRRLYENDTGGERSYLTEAQKAAQIQTSMQNIALGCS